MGVSMELIAAFISGVIGPILYLLIEKYLSKHKEKKRDKVQENIANTCLIDSELEEIRDEFDGDRVWISQFHNGGNFYPTGKSIQKFSIFYEKYIPGISSIQHTFQNIPVSLFPKAMATLYTDGELSIPDFNKEDYDLTSISKPFGTQSFYMIALEDLNDRFIGALAVSYNEEYKFTKEDWIFIRQKAGVIGTLLDEYLNKKK